MMHMIEINVHVSCPDLVAAAKILAGLVREKREPTAVAAVETERKEPTAEPTTLSAAPASAAKPTVESRPVMQTEPVAPVQPSAAIVPVAATPSYTIDQLGKAGADLIAQTNGAAQPKLMELLQKFHVPSLDKLPQAQFGAFATELRGLGARL